MSFTLAVSFHGVAEESNPDLLRPSLSFYPLPQWFPTLGNPGVLGLQLPEILATTESGASFWELQSKNAWVTQGREILHYNTLDTFWSLSLFNSFISVSKMSRKPEDLFINS